MSPSTRTRAAVLLLSVAALLAALLAPMAAAAQEDDGLDEKWDSERCLNCHDGSDTVVTFPSGEELGIGVDGDAYLSSDHADVGVDCVHCHKDITGFPHEPVTIPDVATFEQNLATSCRQCHWEQYTVAIDEAHALLGTDVRADAPGCVDCHDPHAVEAVPLDHPDTQAVCQDCHAEDVTAEVMAIHTYNPTVTEQASPPPLIFFYLLILAVILGFAAVVWGVVVLVRWARSRPATSEG